MALTLDDVTRIAHLARIDVSAAEAAEVHSRMGGIFTLIEQMRAVDTNGVEPMSHAQDLDLRTRDDIVTATDEHTSYQSIAPQVEADLYLVPKVIE
ncbi:MAG TPA: Asp-tRNA(Asn)/Glu-tRNA(Gln) amidotransferase subunit GatC [Candidatus Binatia bacterium]|jgi:aspartyl-tRNA(Asn)/glutamyl-tRNA(Gln) amidotransferase subunit C|nr:Asp-tRNA(Asn)/Glu-tRNA(Gln) amidotransferase subunit GatC [Candidatus Binatia bacterium]